MLWILRMAAYEHMLLRAIPDYAIGQQSVSLAREVAGELGAKFMNAVLRRLLPMLPASCEALDSLATTGAKGVPLDPCIRYSIPREIYDALASGYGDAVMPALLRALGEEETRVFLRVNRLKISTEEAMVRLSEEGVEVELFPGVAGVLRWIPGGRTPWQTESWKRGELTVQDPGAMLAVELLDPRPGEVVVDACAAPGGKTGQIWERMEGCGELHAVEIDPKRRRVLEETLERLYGREHSIHIHASWNKLKGEVQAILLDVPCQALGLLRRHPEARWDHRLGRAAEVREAQTSILDAAAKRLAPGGRLVWSTCSPTRAENEELLGAWVANHLDFELADLGVWPGPASADWIQKSGGVARTRPDLAPVDGFSMAVVRRKTPS